MPGKVLLYDDDANWRARYTALLEGAGYQVDVRSSGVDLIKEIHRDNNMAFRYTAVVLDIYENGEAVGVGVARALREYNSLVYLIFATSVAADITRAMAKTPFVGAGSAHVDYFIKGDYDENGNSTDGKLLGSIGMALGDDPYLAVEPRRSFTQVGRLSLATEPAGGGPNPAYRVLFSGHNQGTLPAIPASLLRLLMEKAKESKNNEPVIATDAELCTLSPSWTMDRENVSNQFNHAKNAIQAVLGKSVSIKRQEQARVPRGEKRTPAQQGGLYLVFEEPEPESVPHEKPNQPD